MKLEAELRAEWKAVLKKPGRVPQDQVEAYKKDVQLIKERKYVTSH
ncbi:hypothetical protein [Salinimicrobium sp. GXAS 041]